MEAFPGLIQLRKKGMQTVVHPKKVALVIAKCSDRFLELLKLA